MMGKNEKPNILVVDDQEANLQAMEVLLSQLEVTVVRATSGQEALAATLEHDFAAVLLDVQMPEMDGYEVATYLRSHPRTQFIPLVFVTAIDQDEQRELQGYGVGAVDFLFKPVDETILLSKVRVFAELWRQRRGLQSEAEELARSQLALEAVQEQLDEVVAEVADEEIAPSPGVETTDAEESVEAGPPRYQGRVLVAEDNPANQALIEILLKKRGLTPEIVSDGAACLARTREDEVDLVLTDMQMPGMSGLELTQQLRAEGFDRPIVAVTALAMEGDAEKCLAAGCDDYLAKPIAMERLDAILGRYLQTVNSR